MIRTIITRRVAPAVGALAACVALSSCAKKITDEQLTQLHSLKHEIAELDNSIQQNNTEQSRVNSELQTETAQLQKCTSDQQFVKTKLAQWPDVWPDWHPAPPPAPPSEEPAKKPEHHRRHRK